MTTNPAICEIADQVACRGPRHLFVGLRPPLPAGETALGACNEMAMAMIFAIMLTRTARETGICRWASFGRALIYAMVRIVALTAPSVIPDGVGNARTTINRAACATAHQ